MNFRIGQGFDVHRLVAGRELWLCGIRLEHSEGLLGHSDADVALRDIGYHFPDTDPAYKGADSKRLLAEVCRMVGEKGWMIGNVDVTIMAEAPKINPYVEPMRDCVAGIIGIDRDCVSIKATTTERLGFTGRKEGIASMAVASLYK